MKIKDGFMMRRIADMQVVVPVGDTGVDFNGVITLNDTAAFLFAKLSSEISREALLEQLLEEYDIDAESAMEDIGQFLEQLEEANLLV